MINSIFREKQRLEPSLPVTTGGQSVIGTLHPLLATPEKLAILLTIAFFALAAFGLSRHEMWSDELQAWLIARDSVSLPDLFQNLRYEGHPVLWYLCLFTITRFTRNPVAMQVFHLLVATAGVYVMARWSPFPTFQKILLTFGYFSAWEYVIISRSYVLGVLLLFVYCATYNYRKPSYPLAATVITLMASTSAYNLFIGAALGAGLVYDFFVNQRASATVKQVRVFYISVLIVGAVMVLTMLSLRPPADAYMPSVPTKFDIRPVPIRMGKTVIQSFLPLPPMYQWSFWNQCAITDALDNVPPFVTIDDDVSLVTPAVGIFLFVVTFLLLRPTRQARLVYLVGSALVVTFASAQSVVGMRHKGMLFLLFIACLWIAAKEDNAAGGTLYPPARRSDLRQMMLVMLTIQFGAAAWCYTMDYCYPFASSATVASYLKANHLDHLPIVGSNDAGISPITAYLDVPYYQVESKRSGTFIIWGKDRRKDQASKMEIAAAVIKEMERTHGDVILVLNPALPAFRPESLPPGLRFTALAHFGPNLYRDTFLFIYRAHRNQPDNTLQSASLPANNTSVRGR